MSAASNATTLQWPARSGRRREFPEVDRAAWFDLTEAERKLIAAQRALLRALRDRLAPS